MSVRDPIITCFLTFSSPGPAVLVQGFKVNTGYSDDEGEDNEEFEMNLGERHAEIFSQASMTIRTHPLLDNIKQLRIQDKYNTRNHDQLTQITSEVRQFLKSVGPLDALTLGVSDLRPYLAPFLDLPGSRNVDQLDGFPPTKKLNHTATRQAWRHDCCRGTRKVATHAGCALRICGDPHEGSSPGDDGVAEPVGLCGTLLR